MLDHLRLAIPVLDIYIKSYGNRHYYNGDMFDLGLTCATRYVSRTDDGMINTGDLYFPYDKIPSSYTDMAFKFYTDTTNIVPYVELKASPLKLLQGHNVYGFDCIKNGACEMLAMLINSYPKLAQILDFTKTEVMHLDTTFFFRLPHQNMVQPVLEYLSKCQGGQRKAKQIKHENYVTWGNDEKSRYINIKAYGKYLELQEQMKKISKQAEKGCKRSQFVFAQMEKVQDFAMGVVRLEARICKTYLTKNGYPSNLWQLICYQQNNPNLLVDLWNVSFKPILKSLSGEAVRLRTDDDVLELLRSKLFTINKKGQKVYTQANNAYKFYVSLQQLGWEQVKALTTNATFHRNVKNLVDCGISRSYLQNLHTHQGARIIPFTRLVEIKFDEQLPPDYVMPESKYIGLYEMFKSEIGGGVKVA